MTFARQHSQPVSFGGSSSSIVDLMLTNTVIPNSVGCD